MKKKLLIVMFLIPIFSIISISIKNKNCIVLEKYVDESTKLAIYIDEEKSFKIPTKDSGYYLDNEKSTCNHAEVTWDISSWTPIIRNFSYGDERLSCQLYFSKQYLVSYKNFDNGNAPNLIKENDILVVTLPNDINQLKIMKDDILLIQDQNYTFLNHVLTIPNVNGNISIENVTLHYGMVVDSLIAIGDEDISSDTSFGYFELSKDVFSTNDKFQYTSDGGLSLSNKNPVSLAKVQGVSLAEEYSLYLTIKTDSIQKQSELFPSTILAISNQSTNYFHWLGILEDYMHVYSYFKGGAKQNILEEFTENGFISFNFSSYYNKKINIQITAKKGDTTKVYINGTLVKAFPSGDQVSEYSTITIGDLRKDRGLKYTGTLYDIAFYSRVLTEDEVRANYSYAKSMWGL